MMRVLVIMAALCTAAAAEGRDVHMGVNMRTALGAHAFRLELGGRMCAFEALVVLDPNSSRDGETDLDVVGLWWFREQRWAVLAGWRNTAFNLLGENRWHENVIVGMNARLPGLGPHWIRTNAGIEVAVDVLRHGSDTPNEWISFASERHFTDLVHVGLFARIEFASAL